MYTEKSRGASSGRVSRCLDLPLPETYQVMSCERAMWKTQKMQTRVFLRNNRQRSARRRAISECRWMTERGRERVNLCTDCHSACTSREENIVGLREARSVGQLKTYAGYLAALLKVWPTRMNDCHLPVRSSLRDWSPRSSSCGCGLPRAKFCNVPPRHISGHPLRPASLGPHGNVKNFHVSVHMRSNFWKFSRCLAVTERKRLHSTDQYPMFN